MHSYQLCNSIEDKDLKMAKPYHVSMAQHHAIQFVEQRMSALSNWCSQIFDFGETAWREYQSCEWYVDRLQQEGFSVEEGSGGMPTAFCADWSNGSGPTLGLYAEYDGIPGNCQAADTRKKPRDGLDFPAGGHTDPHSGLGISNLGALLAIKSAMEQFGIKGRLRFTGEPAEKVRGSKPIHAAKGYYDGLAAILSFHPFYMLPMCNTVRWNTHCGAAYSMIYRFVCDAPERWGHTDGSPIPQAHSAARAPGANDALMMMYQSSKALRDAMLPHQGGWSISEAILTAGQATADNLPAELAEIQYMIRVPSLDMAEQVTRILDQNAQAAAQVTGCRSERHWVSKSRHGLPNHAIASLVWQALEYIGPPHWDEAAKAIARDIQRNLGVTPLEDPFIEELSTLIHPQDAEDALRQDLPPSQLNSTSDDYTEMCWHAPTSRLYIARPALKASGTTAHPSWVMNAMGGIPTLIDPMIITAAKTQALAALRLLEDEKSRRLAYEEFERRKDEAGAIPPLCDYDPPINFRWPEYVETRRGRDWSIPARQ